MTAIAIVGLGDDNGEAVIGEEGVGGAVMMLPAWRGGWREALTDLKPVVFAIKKPSCKVGDCLLIVQEKKSFFHRKQCRWRSFFAFHDMSLHREQAVFRCLFPFSQPPTLPQCLWNLKMWRYRSHKQAAKILPRPLSTLQRWLRWRFGRIDGDQMKEDTSNLKDGRWRRGERKKKKGKSRKVEKKEIWKGLWHHTQGVSVWHPRLHQQTLKETENKHVQELKSIHVQLGFISLRW